MKEIQANQNAPAFARQEAFINAPLQLVWAILVDFAKWPEWNESVTEMNLQGQVAVGTAFHWIAGGMKIRSRIEQVDSLRKIVWSGRTMGIRAIHVWTLTEEQNGTRARTEESFEGLLVRLLAKTMRKALDKALIQGLVALKREAEKRPGGTIM